MSRKGLQRWRVVGTPGRRREWLPHPEGLCPKVVG